MKVLPAILILAGLATAATVTPRTVEGRYSNIEWNVATKTELLIRGDLFWTDLIFWESVALADEETPGVLALTEDKGRITFTVAGRAMAKDGFMAYVRSDTAAFARSCAAGIVQGIYDVVFLQAGDNPGACAKRADRLARAFGVDTLGTYAAKRAELVESVREVLRNKLYDRVYSIIDSGVDKRSHIKEINRLERKLHSLD